jgi:hypothetical protein
LVQLCGGVRPRPGTMGMEHRVSACHVVVVGARQMMVMCMTVMWQCL